MPPALPTGDPAVVSRPMQTTEGGSAANVPGPADAPPEASPATTEVVAVAVVAVLAGAVLRFATGFILRELGEAPKSEYAGLALAPNRGLTRVSQQE